MLAIAKEKLSKQQSKEVLFLDQDMTQFELYGTVDAIICLCDGMNYITHKSDLLKIFKIAKNYLNPNGLFIFDMKTQYNYEQISTQTFAQTEENAAYIWENYYDKKRRLNEYAVTFFIEQNGSYKRFEEIHYQRAYSIEEITQLAAKSTLNTLKILDMDKPSTLKSPNKKTRRVCFIMEA